MFSTLSAMDINISWKTWYILLSSKFQKHVFDYVHYTSIIRDIIGYKYIELHCWHSLTFLWHLFMNYDLHYINYHFVHFMPPFISTNICVRCPSITRNCYFFVFLCWCSLKNFHSKRIYVIKNYLNLNCNIWKYNIANPLKAFNYESAGFSICVPQ